MHKMRVLTVAALLAAPMAHADLTDEQLREKGYDGSIEAGFNVTTGNSETSGYRTALSLQQMFIDWRNKYVFESSYAKSSGEVSEERYFASGQSNRSFSERHYGFGRASYENDRFNGLEDSVTASAGLGYLIFDTTEYYWDIEAGPGYRYNGAQDTSSEFIGRAATNFWYQISPTSKFSEQFSVEGGSENVISRSDTSLTANVIGSLAMKVSFVVTHQTDPADNSDGTSKENLDTKTSLTLLYAF